MSSKQPGRFEGGVGYFIGVASLVVQGIFLVRALNHPSEDAWITWAVVLVVIIVIDALVVRLVARRRNKDW